LWCDRYGNDGGDNIDLVREIEPGTGYAEAVYRLSGAPVAAAVGASARSGAVAAGLSAHLKADRRPRRSRCQV
ncbi:hypothetical protein, partial [Aeromonas caviae]|uniref:hypothetical protein n=1 Tax=Aeromonas caviae TaxID=648 RepID=UPI001CC4FACF